MTTRSKAAKGLAWLVGGRIGNAGLSILSTAILARLLTPADFGIVAAAMIVLALANVVFDGAFGVNLMRKKILRVEDIRTTLTMATVVAFALAALLLCSARTLEAFFKFPGLAEIVATSSVVIPMKAVFAIGSAMLQREGRFRSIALASLLGQFSGYVAVSIPLSLAGFGAWSLVAAMVVSGLVEAVVTGVAARLPLRPCLDKRALIEIHQASLFSVANILNWVANTGTNFVVGSNMGAIGLGLYSRGWKLLDLVVSATATPLGRVLIPLFASRRTDSDRLTSSFLATISLVIPTYSIASALLTIQSPLIIDVALGRQWTDTIPVAQILFATLMPRCAFKVSENFAIAVGKSSSAALRQGLYAILMVGGALVGVHYGIVGVALSTSAAIVAFYLASMSFAVRIGGIPVLDVIQVHAKSALLALITGGVDVLALSWLQEAPLFVRHVAAGGAGVAVVIACISIRPAFWIGNSNADAARMKIQPLLDKFSMSRSGGGH